MAMTLAASTTTQKEANDGTPCLVRRWPVTGDPWARMLLVHGAGEHSGRYERTGGLFAEAGIDVTAFDLRGSGGSAGRRGDVEHWDLFLDDIASMLEMVRYDATGSAAYTPVILMGHSMGGLICTDEVLSGRPVPDLLVLSSPALGDGLPRWQHTVGPVIARIFPTLPIKNGWGPEALSRDPEVGRLAREDPGCPRAARSGWAHRRSRPRPASTTCCRLHVRDVRVPRRRDWHASSLPTRLGATDLVPDDVVGHEGVDDRHLLVGSRYVHFVHCLHRAANQGNVRCSAMAALLPFGARVECSRRSRGQRMPGRKWIRDATNGVSGR